MRVLVFKYSFVHSLWVGSIQQRKAAVSLTGNVDPNDA